MGSDIKTLVNEAQNSVHELKKVNANLDEIAYILGYGFESLANRIDKTNTLLTDIHKVLSKPVATKAAEFLDIASKFYADGFYEDAEENFLKVVDLDKANYVSWYMLGIIRSENLGDRDGAKNDALAALEVCEKYASVRSKYYFSKALLQRALIVHAVDKDLPSATSIASEAVNADPDNTQAQFFLAELYAEQGDIARASQQLQLCEPVDTVFYMRSANSTPLLESGVHARVYDEITKSLKKFNAHTMSILENYRLSATELDKTIGEGSSLVKQLDEVCFLVKGSSAEDYLAQRLLHDMLREQSKQIGSSLESSLQELNSRI